MNRIKKDLTIDGFPEKPCCPRLRCPFLKYFETVQIL
jgi:hypothetical protein